MGHFHLAAGLVIQRAGQTLELVSRTLEKLHFEEPTTGERETLSEAAFWHEFQTSQIRILDAFSSPKQLIYPLEPIQEPLQHIVDLPEHHQRGTLRRLQYVRRMEAIGLTSGQTKLISIEAKKFAKEIEDPEGSPSAASVQRWWRAVKKRPGEVFVVVNKNAFSKRGVRLDPDSEAYLQQKIEELYLQLTRPTAMGAHRGYVKALQEESRTRKDAGLAPLRKVSYRTFKNRIDALSQEEVMVARLGKEAARHYFNMVKGHLPARLPLDVVEIDHTPLNVYVIDNVSCLPLGRPWMTAIKDRYTGMVLGFYISFRQTGLQSVFGAIKHSLQSHHYVRAMWPDLENDWPAFGLGAEYVSDRGGDFVSLQYRIAVTSLGANYGYNKKKTPWLKGSIERFFRTLEQTFFEAMPGRTFSSLKERRDYKPADDAVIRFSTFIYLMHKWCVDYHNVTLNLRKQKTSLQLWNEGIQIAPPIHIADRDKLDVFLGEHHDGRLSHEGIRFEWLQYADEGLHEVLKQFGKNITLDYVVSPDNLGQIQVKHPKTGEYFPVRCTRPDYAEGLSLYQHRYIRKIHREENKENPTVDMLMDTRADIQETIREELNSKKAKSHSHFARVAEINSNRVLEGETQTIHDPFAGQTVDRPIKISVPCADVKIYAWG